jgi:hypothetical protein
LSAVRPCSLHMETPSQLHDVEGVDRGEQPHATAIFGHHDAPRPALA